LSDSFEGGEPAWMRAFREEVTADTEQRGLTRPRLSGRRVGLLCLVLLVPAGTLALALTGAHQPDPLVFPVVSWFVLSMVTIGAGGSRHPSAAGCVRRRGTCGSRASPGGNCPRGPSRTCG
jgi:hypothetical protein